MSRIQASSLGIGTTAIPAPRRASASATSSGWVAIRTGSTAAIAVATAAKASRAGPASARQLSGRRGQAIQVPEWRSNSPGIRNPSAAGVDGSGPDAITRP